MIELEDNRTILDPDRPDQSSSFAAPSRAGAVEPRGNGATNLGLHLGAHGILGDPEPDAAGWQTEDDAGGLTERAAAARLFRRHAGADFTNDWRDERLADH